MGFSTNVNLPAITVFVQGLLSFFSPCVLPLLPLYISYLSGETTEETHSRGRTLRNTLFFVLGISFAFFLLGIGMSAVGAFFHGSQAWFVRIGGVLVILFGLYQLGVLGSPAILERERKLPVNLDRLAMSPLTAFLMGFTFSFGWTPCVGPALSSVLLLAAGTDTRAQGFLLILVYTLGFVLPFLAVGLFTSSLLDLFRRHRGVVRYTAKIGGVLMLILGLLMLTGNINRISGYFAGLGGTPAAAVVAETEAQTTGEPTETERTEESIPLTENQEAISAETEAEETAPEETEVAETEEAILETAEEEMTAEEDTAAALTPAADFELHDQYGQVHRLSDYRGKVVFLNFWATWCPPCRAEMPYIQNLYEKYREEEDSEVVILGVAFPGLGNEEDEAGVAAYLEENGYTYPVVMDTEAELMESYWITAYPTTFMIDREGNLFGYITGGIDQRMMQSIINQTLEGKRTDTQ